MAVYVDDMRLPARVGSHQARWSHLFTDGPPEELHTFAAGIGLRRAWFQHKPPPAPGGVDLSHYDVTDTKRALALAHGAVSVPAHRSAEILRDAATRRAGVA